MKILEKLAELPLEQRTLNFDDILGDLSVHFTQSGRVHICVGCASQVTDISGIKLVCLRDGERPDKQYWIIETNGTDYHVNEHIIQTLADFMEVKVMKRG
ncbi:hypothetical protein AB4367_13325 [Vibrio breoganii]